MYRLSPSRRYMHVKVKLFWMEFQQTAQLILQRAPALSLKLLSNITFGLRIAVMAPHIVSAAKVNATRFLVRSQH
ncbi:hypothetical protein BFL43_08070 [Williamsia sp. 1135]|nr:hypothetical protein BFL43_08070 [Williamsia sp. 1135]